MLKQMKNIHNIVVDGPNGVGKSTLIKNIFKKYNYRYMCYHRGDISNYVYSKIYDRPFFSTQRHLPFLHIVLNAKPETLKQRILNRAEIESWSKDQLEKELQTVHEASKFIAAANDLQHDYFIVDIQTDDLSEEELANKVFNILDCLCKNQPQDDENDYSAWNVQYLKACKRLNKDFKVVDNQPYIDNVPIMVETTCHDGMYETFSNKKCFDNLIYAYGYFERDIKENKAYDFNYIINSKIHRRHELLDYFSEFELSKKSCIISDYKFIKDNFKSFSSFPKCHGSPYLHLIAKSQATIYCARDLAYLKLQTARLYESIIANNVVFVDRLSDLDCEILKNIHGEDSQLIHLLYVEPKLICKNYEEIMSDETLKQKILDNQHRWLNQMFDNLERSK